MIQINFFYNSVGELSAFKIKGHAPEYICSAVSLFTINTVNCIEKFTTDKFICNYDKKSGLIDFKFTDKNISHDSKILIMALEFGLKDVVQKYDKFVCISEVKSWLN